jgi:hypothetical protein
MVSRSAIEQLKHHLLASLGVAPALLLGACASETPGDDEGGVTTNPSSSATTLDDGNDGNDGTTSGGSGVPPNPTTGMTTSPDPDDGDPGDGDGDDGFKLDVAQDPDLPPLGDCTVMQTEPAVLDEHPEGPARARLRNRARAP